jgi:RAB protein geranylgeranyltransferase component A
MDELLDEVEFDAIVLGTGLTESILSAFVSPPSFHEISHFSHFQKKKKTSSEHWQEQERRSCTWTSVSTMVEIGPR